MLLDERPYVRPPKAAIATPKSRECDGLDLKLKQDAPQIDESLLNVTDPRLRTPVLLRREVDDEARGFDRAALEDEHLPELQFVSTACRLVRPIVVGERLLELERDALAHNADRVHGVD